MHKIMNIKHVKHVLTNWVVYMENVCTFVLYKIINMFNVRWHLCALTCIYTWCVIVTLC